MKSKYIIPIFFLGTLIYLPFLTNGQYTVSKVNSDNANTTADGFYYFLPRTILQIDITVEKIEQIRGPLADYTENYLGTSDFIASDKNIFRVINLNMKPVYEADPDQVYFVQFPLDKAKDEKVSAFQLTEIGTLLAFDHEETAEQPPSSTIDQTILVMEGSDDFQYHPDYHRKKKIDTIVRKITIDTLSIERFLFKTSWVDKSMEDKANEAALQITNIREARFNLLTGYQEVNYGESMRYMDSQLLKMERQYLELFLGKEVKTYENHTVYYLPEKGIVDASLLGLPGGNNIDISVKPRRNTTLLPETAVVKSNNIYFRIPEMTDIEISYNAKVIYRNSMSIGQLGVVSSAPLPNTRSQFDPATGSLIKIVRE